MDKLFCAPCAEAKDALEKPSNGQRDKEKKRKKPPKNDKRSEIEFDDDFSEGFLKRRK
jgi:hypothetical protein